MNFRMVRGQVYIPVTYCQSCQLEWGRAYIKYDEPGMSTACKWVLRKVSFLTTESCWYTKKKNNNNDDNDEKKNTCSFTPVGLDIHWVNNLTYGKMTFCDILDPLKNQIKPKEHKIYSRFSHRVQEFSDPWRAIWAHHLFWHHSGSSSTYWAVMMAIGRRGKDTREEVMWAFTLWYCTMERT